MNLLLLFGGGLFLLIVGTLLGRYYAPDKRPLHQAAKEGRSYARGLVDVLEGKDDAAIEELKRALRENTKTVEAYFALGALFRNRGEYERAVRVHQTILVRRDIDKKTRLAVDYQLALDFRAAGFPRRAVRALEWVIAHDRKHVDALSDLAALYETLGSWERAAGVHAKLGKLERKRRDGVVAHLMAQRAQELIEAGDLKAARRALRRAVSADSNAAKVRSHATQAPNMRSHATQAPNMRSHATQAPNMRSHATQAPNMRSHATQAPNMRSHATQAPNMRSHATQAPNMRSHATQAPNMRSHATQAPNMRSHATQAPNMRSHATQAPNMRSHATQAPHVLHVVALFEQASKKTDVAAKTWKKALTAAPDFASFFVPRLEVVLFELERLFELRELLEQLMARHPGNVHLRLAHARLLAKSDADEARVALVELLDDYPRLLPARKEAARLVLASGDDEAIRQALEELLQVLSSADHGYRCKVCGHADRELFWRCPSCGSWDGLAVAWGRRADER
jgi:lipopolysaccharide biosynthesis regulator YciM